MTQSAGVRPQATAAVVVLALAVVAIAALHSAHSPGAAPAPPSDVSSPTAANQPPPSLRIAGEATVEAVDTVSVIVLPVRNPGPAAVTVAGVSGTASAVTSDLPPGGLRVAAAATAGLRLRWTGPDCSAPVPDRVLPSVVVDLAGNPGAGNPGADVTLDTTALDATLIDAWRAACDDTAQNIPDGAFAPSSSP